jgi:hypothetical protein
MRLGVVSAFILILVGCGTGAVPDAGDFADADVIEAPDGGGSTATDGGDAPDAGAATDGGGGTGDAGPSEAQRLSAATETAQRNPACSLTTMPEGFYWEIGDRSGARASGVVRGTNTPAPSQVIAIASASKWVYSTYVLQKVGMLRSTDIPFLTFTSGEVFSTPGGGITCGLRETVAECAMGVTLRPSAVGRFFYDAGHFQRHATATMGLGPLSAAGLSSEVSSVLSAPDFEYPQPNLAGGLTASASGYAAFLQRMLRGEFVMAAHLGTQKVCASAACSAGAVQSPAPPQEAWSYSLGHWVEDDAALGDGATSSAGALGFYPWIDRTKTWYGLVARRAATPGGNQGVVSLRCGRLIRQAWVTGIATLSPVPTP